MMATPLWVGVAEADEVGGIVHMNHQTAQCNEDLHQCHNASMMKAAKDAETMAARAICLCMLLICTSQDIPWSRCLGVVCKASFSRLLLSKGCTDRGNDDLTDVEHD